MNKKILRTFLIIFCMFVIFNLNEVFGVGIVSQAWTNDVNGDGRADLVYRTYTTPHWSTVRDYHNLNKNGCVNVTNQYATKNYRYKNSWSDGTGGDGKFYTSKWIDTSTQGLQFPSIDTFRTIGIAFHTKPMGDYSSRGANYVGYNKPINELGQWMNTIDVAYNSSTVQYATPAVAINYNNVVFYELMRATPNYKTVNWGTGLVVTSAIQNKKTQLRYCIVNIGGTNVYVSDTVVYAEDLAQIVNEAKKAGVKGNEVYISDIVISEAYPKGSSQYEVSRTSYEFFYKQNGKNWSASSRGRVSGDNKAMGSVANLYDNKLILPQTSTRKVLVRHINIGMNTEISRDIINNSKPVESTNKTFTASNPTATITDNPITTYSGYQEYYQDKIGVDRAVTKVANKDTAYYRCIGYNIAVSTDLGTAQTVINTQIENGKFNKGTTAIASAKPATADSDYVVIDFYYTEYEKDVYVNHLFVDEDGYVKDINKQNILPNNTAKINGVMVNRINTDRYISEVYKKKMGHNVYTRKADSVDLIDNLEYWGYETSTTNSNLNELVGKQKVKDKLTTRSKDIPLTSSDVQVNLYYHKKDDVELVEPEKNIGGNIFVTGKSNELTVSCNDQEQSIQITSVPSGTDVKVGIEKIPRYMVGAITTEYASVADAQHSMNLSLTFKMGAQTKTIDFDEIKYRVGYYKVTDMAVYKLKNMTIYDAEKGYTGTIGKSLFSWQDGKLNIEPNNMDLNIKLTGISGNTIKNTPSQINNINNYVAVSIEDKYGNKSDKGSANSNLSRTYLTEKQLAEVDANGDGIVDNKDKIYVVEKLSEYNTVLTNMKNEQATEQTNYNNLLQTRRALETALNTAKMESNRLYNIWQDLEGKKTERLIGIMNAQNDIASLKEITLANLEGELEELKLKENQMLEVKNTSQDKLDVATSEKDRLNQEYIDSINLRAELAAKANCTDSVEEDVYIYLEQEEKEALEQCKLDKEAYAKNLQDQVVEKASEKYNSYYENEWNKANNEYQTATAEYNTAVTNRQNKEKEINTTNITINQKEQAVEILDREYQKFIKDEYTPAKNAYESYKNQELQEAQNAYDDNIASKDVETALEILNQAKNETRKAQEEYNKYKAYKDNLEAKYTSYKAAYDEFISLDKKTAAETLGLKLNVFVQNMTVKVNGQTITNAKSNTKEATYDISELISSEQIPQIRTERPVISQDVYSNIGSTLMSMSDFTNSNYIEKDKLNGISVLAGKAEYETQVVIGNKKASEIEDTIYYSDQSNDEKRVIFRLKNNNITKTYMVDNKSTNEEKYKQTLPINIYTPITVKSELESDTNQIINQTANENMTNSVIQINTPFTIKLSNDVKPLRYNINNTNRFSGGYYVKFAFDVHKVTVNGKLYNNGNRISAGTWIGLIEEKGSGKTYITAQAYGNIESDDLSVVNEDKSSYTVRAVAYNASEIIKSRSVKYQGVYDMVSETSEINSLVNNTCAKPSYFAEENYDIIIVNRAFDFRVTDVADVNWKSVFRKNTSANTNTHKSIVYYSGTTKWNTKSEKTNEIIQRTSSEIGRAPLRILPIGPYKNTTTTYTKAPKIGYRFSFDMKVTGSYYEVVSKTELKPKESKKVEINTNFYYISKNGKTYLPEYTKGKEGIYLFYKTSSGKYVRIDENGGGYNLNFTPNDGYRYIEDNNISTLAETQVSLGNLRTLTLKYNMATVSNNGSVITYYGEYKLPNSTIAVKVNADGTYDINSPLKDGYIGVIFDIVAYSGKAKLGNKEEDVQLSYAKDTKSSANTSQWDYEGFLGYTNFGQRVLDSNPIKLKLEKGTWNINQDMYQAIKGTVMLYDLDLRAATDYE